MSRSLMTPALGLLLAAATLSAPTAHAGNLNSSETAVMVSLVLTVSVPLAASAGLVELSKAPFKASEKNRSRTPARVPAQPLPDMQVKDVKTDPQGGCEVQLQVPGKDDQTATLTWAKRDGSPADGFVVGQTVAFVPTPTGAGWNINDTTGKPLAYVPTASAAADSASGEW